MSIQNFLNMTDAEYLEANREALQRLIEQQAHPALIAHWQERVRLLEAMI